MAVARRQPAPTRSADIVPVLYQVRDALAPELAAKDLTLTLDAPQAGLICAHDPDTLEHALIAMVVNAIEASPLGGMIRIEASHVPTAGNGRRCRVAVHDLGEGLPPGQPERIFDFQYSTKQRGMGLGLALARQALERQGGKTGA
jgi:signal transduction histidine kinase